MDVYRNSTDQNHKGNGRLLLSKLVHLLLQKWVEVNLFLWMY